MRVGTLNLHVNVWPRPHSHTALSVFSAVAWHPVHEGLFASGGSDGSLLFWHAGYDETSVGHAHSLLPFLIHSLCSHQIGWSHTSHPCLT